MTDETITYSAGPQSEWTNGSSLKVRIKETKYKNTLWFKVFFGSDRKPLLKQPIIPDIEWRLYLSRDAAPLHLFSDIELGLDVQYFLFEGSNHWAMFTNIERAVEIYERVTNQVRERLGFDKRTISDKWRVNP